MSSIPYSTTYSIPPLILSDKLNINGKATENIKSSIYINNISCWKISVDYVSTESRIRYGQGIFEVNKTILLAGQDNPVQNGVYTIRNSTWLRSPDMPENSKSGGVVIMIKGDPPEYYTCTTPEGIVGVDEISFIKGVIVVDPIGENRIQYKGENGEMASSPNLKLVNNNEIVIGADSTNPTFLTNHLDSNAVDDQPFTIEVIPIVSGSLTFNSTGNTFINTVNLNITTFDDIDINNPEFVLNNDLIINSLTNITTLTSYPITFKNDGFYTTKTSQTVTYPDLFSLDQQGTLNISGLTIPVDSYITYTINAISKNVFMSSKSPEVYVTFVDGKILIYNLTINPILPGSVFQVVYLTF